MCGDMFDEYKDYAKKVLSGEITAGRYIKLSCQRYLNYFENPNLYFDTKKVDGIINFISKLKHFSGASAGKPFILQPWQKWVVYSIYGFHNKETHLRLVTKAFILIARKNGKSAFASALALYELLLGENGAQVYNIASSREQSALLFDMEKEFSKSIDPKRKFLKIQRDRIF